MDHEVRSPWEESTCNGAHETHTGELEHAFNHACALVSTDMHALACTHARTHTHTPARIQAPDDFTIHFGVWQQELHCRVAAPNVAVKITISHCINLHHRGWRGMPVIVKLPRLPQVVVTRLGACYMPKRAPGV